MEISIPARSNIPPFEPKSFCMSTTMTTVLAVSIAIGSGFASSLIKWLVVPPLEAPGANKSVGELASHPLAVPATLADAAINPRREVLAVHSAMSTWYRDDQSH